MHSATIPQMRACGCLPNVANHIKINQTLILMKKLVIFFLVLMNIETYSQITLDFQSPITDFVPIKLTDSNTKYFDSNQWNMNHQNQFSLYNLDGTLYKTILMPPKPDTICGFWGIGNISESLFDNDHSNIEYIVSYGLDSVSSSYTYYRTRIIREDGTILLDELYAWSYYVYNTEEG